MSGGELKIVKELEKKSLAGGLWIWVKIWVLIGQLVFTQQCYRHNIFTIISHQYWVGRFLLVLI